MAKQRAGWNGGEVGNCRESALESRGACTRRGWVRHPIARSSSSFARAPSRGRYRLAPRLRFRANHQALMWFHPKPPSDAAAQARH